MAVHFKFRSAVAFDSINVEGNGITVGNLKDRIVAHKNLGRSNDFDLVITNAESGEEYPEDGFVPKNTSIIIKRVPARRGIGTLLVHDDASSDDVAAGDKKLEKHGDTTHLAMTSTMDELYDMDDFGVDFYAIDESALTNVEADENSNTSALLGRANAHVKRSTQETHLVFKDTSVKSNAKGLCHNRAVPPSGYVCHRCGQPGHFIQHCPTNGDPAYDMKKIPRPNSAPEDSSKVAAAVSQSNNNSAKDIDKVPPELCCSLCQGIFKEAVMIPCCQYSFCDTCIKQSLMDKGLCPQCGSERSRSVDLLPNVALRQAIDRFTSSQVEPMGPNEGADVESTIKATNVTSQGNPYSNKPVLRATSTVVVENMPDQAVVDDSVCESAIGSKGMNGPEGSKIGADGDASFTGRKKKKAQTRQSSVSDGVTEQTMCKPRKANKFCYLCGSPDHLARHCDTYGGESAGTYPPQRPMFHPATQVPRGMTPYGQEMYWPGQPVLHVRPLPMAYGDGMYGPCSAMPYASPALPIPPYSVSSYQMYPNPSIHGFLSNIPPMVAPRERPLSREEFLELQERERRRRERQERHERDLSDESPESVGGERELPSASEQSLYKQRSGDKYQATSRRCEYEENYSKEAGCSKGKHKHNRKPVSESHFGNEDFHNRCDEDTEADTTVKDCRHRTYPHKRMSSLKPTSSLPKKASKEIDKPEREDGQTSKSKSLRDGHAHLGKQSCSVRHDVISFEKHDHSKHEANDAAEVSYSSCHKNKRISTEPEGKEKHNSHAYDVIGDSISDCERKNNGKKRQSQMKGDTTEYTSGEEIKKKRNHKKHRSEDLKDMSAYDICDNEAPIRKKQKIKHGTDHDSDFLKFRCDRDKDISPIDENIERSRWQMEDGLENQVVSIRKEKSKHKRQHRHHGHHHHHHNRHH